MKHVHRIALAALLLSALCALPTEGRAQTAEVSPGDGILGEWWTEDREGRVLFTRDKQGEYRATITCCVPKQPTQDDPAQDIHNPNPRQRARSIVGIVVVWKLRHAQGGEYADGKVYDPSDGSTYHLQATLVDRDTLKIRAYSGTPLFGETQLWKRVH